MEHLRWILPLIAAPVVAVLGIVGVIALSARRLTSAPVASDDVMVLFGRDAYQFFLGTLVPLVLLLFIVGLIAYAVYAVGTTFGWIALRETPLFTAWTAPGLLFSPAIAVVVFFVVAFMPFVAGPSEALVPVIERARRVHRVSRRCGRPLVPWNARRARRQACGGCGSSDRRGGRRRLNAESGLVVVRTQF